MPLHSQGGLAQAAAAESQHLYQFLRDQVLSGTTVHPLSADDCSLSVMQIIGQEERGQAELNETG